MKLGTWFSGFGGYDIGAVEAGAEPVFAVEYDPAIAGVYRVNFGDHVTVASVLDLVISQQPYVDLFHVSPPCFPSGVSVVTKRGLVDISQVRIGDYVVTHKSRWRKVTRTWARKSKTVVLDGLGHHGLEATADHPFLASEIVVTYPPHKERGAGNHSNRHMKNPDWLPAEQMTGKHWLSLNAYPFSQIPEMKYSRQEAARGQKFDLNSPDFWWIVGCWLGDGWVRYSDGKGNKRNRGTVHICAGKHEAQALRDKLVLAKMIFNESEQRTTIRFSINSRPFCRWLTRNFGRYANGKTVPSWMLGASYDFRRNFFDGYVFADGCHRQLKTYAEPVITMSTVSKDLAIGIKMIGVTLGYSMSLRRYERHRQALIEGRDINEKPCYMLRASKSERHAKHVGSLYRSGVVRKVRSTHVVKTVYDISVEEDESFVADGIVVHNCPNFSNAKANAKEAANDIAMANKIAEYITFHKPLFFTLENVIAYRDSQSWAIIARALHDCGYSFKWWHVNMADYGVPQTRKRMIVVARRDGKAASLPPATHAKKPMPTLFDDGLKSWVGWYEVVEDLIPTLPDSQFAPWQLDRLPDEYTTFLRSRDSKLTTSLAKLPSMGITTQAGFHKAYLAPASTVVASLHSKAAIPKSLLVGNGDTYRPVVDGGTPSTTLSANNGFRAFLPHTQANSDTDGKYGNEPATTIGTIEQPDRTFVMSSGNANGSGKRPYELNQPMPTLTAGTGAKEGTPKAFIMDAANPHSNCQTKHRYENEPTKTITSSDVLHRANMGRVVKMTPRALARFQSFPDWYKLPECSRKKSEKRLPEYFVYGNPVVLNWATSEYLKTDLTLSCRGIGNAVPSLFAKKLVVHLLESLA